MLDVDETYKEQIVEVLGGLTQNRMYQRLLLGTITEAWVEYLTSMEALRVSISMESYAQRDPLVRYKNEASRMFTELLSEVRAGVISKMFRYRVKQAVDTQSLLKRASGRVLEENISATESAAKPKSKKRKRH